MNSSQYPSDRSGVVRNVNTGSVGNLVQAGDVRGSIDMSADGIMINGVQVGGETTARVSEDLVGELRDFLAAIRDGELSQREMAGRATGLLAGLDAAL